MELAKLLENKVAICLRYPLAKPYLNPLMTQSWLNGHIWDAGSYREKVRRNSDLGSVNNVISITFFQLRDRARTQKPVELKSALRVSES